MPVYSPSFDGTHQLTDPREMARWVGVGAQQPWVGFQPTTLQSQSSTGPHGQWPPPCIESKINIPISYLSYLHNRLAKKNPTHFDEQLADTRQESPAIADKPARRKSLPKLLQFGVPTTLSLTILNDNTEWFIVVIFGRRRLWSDRVITQSITLQHLTTVTHSVTVAHNFNKLNGK